LFHGTSVCWYLKTQDESGPVTADLTTTKLPINDITPVYSLTLSLTVQHHANGKVIIVGYPILCFTELFRVIISLIILLILIMNYANI